MPGSSDDVQDSVTTLLITGASDNVTDDADVVALPGAVNDTHTDSQAGWFLRPECAAMSECSQFADLWSESAE